MKGDHKHEVQAIQQIVGAGLEREEMRDEIFVQCIRQITNNPSPEQSERLWLLLCLTVVAFQPSKILFKVSTGVVKLRPIYPKCVWLKYQN